MNMKGFVYELQEIQFWMVYQSIMIVSQSLNNPLCFGQPSPPPLFPVALEFWPWFQASFPNLLRNPFSCCSQPFLLLMHFKSLASHFAGFRKYLGKVPSGKMLGFLLPMPAGILSSWTACSMIGLPVPVISATTCQTSSQLQQNKDYPRVQHNRIWVQYFGVPFQQAILVMHRSYGKQRLPRPSECWLENMILVLRNFQCSIQIVWEDFIFRSVYA